jgi:hypothetical protein
MGERIVAGNEMFRGRAGEQVRRDYITFVLRETDLRLYACDYGWCVFQPEIAKCGGEVGPSEIGRSPTTCLSCANMVIEEQHAAYWRDRRERNASLIASASPMTAAVLAEAIDQCDRVLARMGVKMQKNEGSTMRSARLAYRAALARLLRGEPNHPSHIGRVVRITPASVAREARRSRNPLYTTHREILDEIATATAAPHPAQDLAARVAELEAELQCEFPASMRDGGGLALLS